MGVDPSDRSAAAAERAAVAAEKAANAAASSAEAVAKSAESVAKIATSLLPPTPGAPVQAPLRKWSGSIGFGLIALTGNSESLTFTGNGSLEHKGDGWTFGGKAFGSYGQATTVDQVSQVVATNAGLQLRIDRVTIPSVSAYALGGAETDHVKSLELRGYGEVGAGITWLEIKEGTITRALMRLDLALRFAHDRRYQYFPTPEDLPDERFLAPRFGLSLRYGLGQSVTFSEDAEVLPNLIGDSRVLVNSLSKVSTRLIGALSLAVSFQISYDSFPAPGKKSTDTALSVGLDILL